MFETLRGEAARFFPRQPAKVGAPPMTTPRVPDGRFRAYLQFVIGLFYYFLARALAHHGAAGLSNELWSPLVEQAMLVFLAPAWLCRTGFFAQPADAPVNGPGPAAAAGVVARDGHGRGPRMGDGGAVRRRPGRGRRNRDSLFRAICGPGAGSLVDVAFFALAALAEEIAFRGYAFQRFSRAVGSAGAVLGFAALYAFLQSLQPGSNRVSMAVAVVFTVLLSIAYLRTRALWISWGINFGWKATRALLFGLAVTGVNSHSPVVQGDPMGPFWLTGGGFGLDGSWLAFFVLAGRDSCRLSAYPRPRFHLQRPADRARWDSS